MAIGAGFVFNVDMSDLDDYIRKEVPDKSLEPFSFSKIKDYIRQPNLNNSFVKLNNDYKKDYDAIKDFYLKTGHLAPERLKAYIDALQPIHPVILKGFDDYANKLRAEFAQKMPSTAKQAQLDRILIEKKQALKEQLAARMLMLKNLPFSINDVMDDESTLAKQYSDSEDWLKSLAQKNQQKTQGHQASRIKSYDSSVARFNPFNPFSMGGGKYSFNRFDSREVYVVVTITKTADGYKFNVAQEGLDGTPRRFYNKNDKDRAYLEAVKQIAKQNGYRLTLESFPENIHDQVLAEWVKSGRTYADVDSSKKDKIPLALFDVIVSKNISHREVKLYCEMSEKDRELLNKQIAKKGEVLTFDDTLDSPLTLKDKDLLNEQITLNTKDEQAPNKAKAQLKKLPSTEYDDATIKKINTLYEKYQEFEKKARYRQGIYELDSIFKATGLSDDKDMQIALSKMPDPYYNRHYNLARVPYIKQGLVNSKGRVIAAHNFDTTSTLELSNFSNKDDFYRTNKKEPYRTQYTSKLSDMSKLVELVGSGKMTQDERIETFKKLERSLPNGDLNWNHQLNFLNKMPLGTNKQNAFLMAQLFLAMRPNHRRLAYKELDLTRQDAIFPFLPESLQRIYDPAKAKEINQNLVNLAEKYNLEDKAVLICHMLEQTFPGAAQDFSSLMGPNPSSDDIDQAVKDIIDNDKLYSAQIGHGLSYLLLREQANSEVSLAIAKNLLSCADPEWAGKIIGQMDPEARGKLLEIIQQDISSISDPEARQLAIKNYADKLVPILNEIYSPNLLKELGSYMQQELILADTPPNLEPSLFLAVVNHRDFSNKFSFEKFIAGAFQKTDKKWLAIQELIHEQMDLSLEIGQGPDRVNRQHIVYAKLADNLQKKITNRVIGNAKIVYEYDGKEKKASFLIKNHTNIADKAVTDSYTPKDKCNEYYVSCMKLYELAEILKASDKDLDVTGLAENKRAFPDNYNKLKDIKLKLEATSELAEDEYNQAIQELQDLKLDEVVQAELNNLEKELPIARKHPSEYIEQIKGAPNSKVTPHDFNLIKTEAKKCIEESKAISKSTHLSDIDKCKVYLANCDQLYTMLEYLKTEQENFDRKNIHDSQRKYSEIHEELKEIRQEFAQINHKIAAIEKNDTIEASEKTNQINELNPKIGNLIRQLQNLQLGSKVTEAIQMTEGGLCPYMKKEAAADLIKQIHNLGDILPEFFEQKAFYNFSEKVQKQVFKELSPETQQILINQTSDLEKKAAWLESLPADKAKDLYLSQQQHELILFKMLPATHQEKIAADKKLDDTVYQKFTEKLASEDKIVLLKELHQKRSVAPALANKYKLDAKPAKLDISNSIANMSSGN